MFRWSASWPASTAGRAAIDCPADSDSPVSAASLIRSAHGSGGAAV
jgi:hypothetical protein